LIILALDTCVDACSVALAQDGRALAAISEPMQRGHQERLAPMVAEAFAAAGLKPDALDRIGVTIGPGSFTGLRVGLAFAKGMALALDRPCVGIGTLEALALSAGPGFVAACLDARRGRVYLQAFADGRAVMAPDILDIDVAAARIAELWSGGPALVAGSGAPLIAGVLPSARTDTDRAPDPLVIARLAAKRDTSVPPRPLYLRAPDAKLPGGKDLGE
jgi:tRNA threonylcarbamoyladenosine biosynthesis protein TsaB